MEMEDESESDDVKITSEIEDDDIEMIDPLSDYQGTNKYKSSNKHRRDSSSSEEDEFEESSSSSDDPSISEEDVPLAKRLLNQDNYQEKTNKTDSDIELESMERLEDPLLNHAIRDDLLRAVMDTIPVGRNYSPQYYYARKMIQDPKWIHRVHNHGVYKTTLLMYKKYAALPTNEKKEFVQQSHEFYERTRGKFGVPRRRRKEEPPGQRKRINPKKPYFFEDEPIPPQQKAKEFYESEMRNKHRFNQFTRWHSIDTNTQLHFVKKQYLKTQKYIYDYEAFVQRMSPPDLLCYVFHLYENWEKMKLEPFLEGKNFIFPMPNVNVADDLRPRLPVIVENPKTLATKTTPPDPNPHQPLANDQFMTWLERKSAPKKRSIKRKAKTPSDVPNTNTNLSQPLTKDRLASQVKKPRNQTKYPAVPSLPQILPKKQPAAKKLKKSRKKKLTNKSNPKLKGRATFKEKKPRKKKITSQTDPDPTPSDPSIPHPNPLPSTNESSSVS